LNLTPFNHNLGVTQGRIETDNDQTVFVLGSIKPGDYHELTTDDGCVITQDADLTNVDLIRTSLEIRIPESTPDGYAWGVVLFADGQPMAIVVCRAGISRSLEELTVNVSKITGTHTVGIGFRLVQI